MTQKALREKEVNGISEKGEVTRLEVQKEDTKSEVMQRFQKQQVTNLQIKETMARELAAMELPADVVDQILHLDNEPPFK
jgi:hypothetical protein